MLKNLTFSKGVRDGLPIALGYLSVSFAFGMICMQNGLPAWAPILISLTNFTGTGQFAGADLIVAGAAFAEIAFTVLIINMRYLLMSLSLSQKLEQKMPVIKRLAIAFGNTDEIFAVAMRQNGELNFTYMMGLILSAFSGWVSGTVLGVFASSFLPASLQSALGIAIYAMFIAIIVPAAKESKPITRVVLIGVLISCVFYYTPVLSAVSKGWVIIISGVISSALGAYFFPLKEEQK
ncbi:MAG: AzlC family ABC transporter permease [Ruminococcaceae bacterium]|nr:AzlC family ABC transporter permease [Oscillospiraceae bacterium]